MGAQHSYTAFDPIGRTDDDRGNRLGRGVRVDGLPSPHLTLILTLDEPLTIAAHPDPRNAPGDYAALLGGLHTAPALIRVPGRQSGAGVKR